MPPKRSAQRTYQRSGQIRIITEDRQVLERVLLVTNIYGNRMSYEITNKHDFESFVTKHNLQEVNLKIVKLKKNNLISKQTS
jgi:hypothetical protein